MSRTSDIAALLNLRDKITDTKFMIQTSKAELAKYEACEKELTTSKFVFQPLPTNQAETAIAKFRNKWIEKYADADPAKNRASVVCTILTVLLAIFFLVDMILMTDIIYNAAELQPINAELIKHFGWFAYLIQVVFSVFIILLPYFFFKEGFQDFYFEHPIACLVAGGILTLLFWLISSAFSSLLPLALFASTLVLHFLARRIVSLVYKIKKKHPRLSEEQKQIVESEKEKDRENAVLNVEKEKTDAAQWQAWWETHKQELAEQMDIHMKMAKSALAQAQELQEQVESSDVLGPNEKHIEAINWLIYFLEGHRADNIKEALQQYDLMLHNEKMLALEQEKLQLEAKRIQQEHDDRRRAMELERYHQMQLEAQAQRAADMQAQIAYNTAATANAAEKMRREAASVAAATADFQNRMASEATWQRLNDYYNN